MTSPKRSYWKGLLRAYVWVLLAALVIGFGIGLWIRARLERPEVHMGALDPSAGVVGSPVARAEDPLGFLHACASVLDPSQHEEQI